MTRIKKIFDRFDFVFYYIKELTFERVQMKMRIENIIWLPHIVDKLAWKHSVTPQEVEEVLFDNPMYRKVQKGHIPGEDMYAALGQTEAGRYLIVFLVYKKNHEALLVSARDMSKKEIKLYGRK